MSHWFDELARGVAARRPWREVGRRVARALRALWVEPAAPPGDRGAERRQEAEGRPNAVRRATVTGLLGLLGAVLIERSISARLFGPGLPLPRYREGDDDAWIA